VGRFGSEVAVVGTAGTPGVARRKRDQIFPLGAQVIKQVLVPLVLIGLATECRHSLTPPPFPDAVPITAKSSYALWWNVVENCSGIHGELTRVRWSMVSRPYLLKRGTDLVYGLWSPRENSITLAQGYLVEGHLVRHEMLHSLLQSGDHDPQYFRVRCGGIA
jgi:hypothetical protein